MAIRTNGDAGYVGIPPLNVPTAPTFATNNYTAVLADKDRFLRLSNSSTAGTFTIPLNSSVPFAIGSQLNVTQSGSGQITLTPATVGVTLNSAGGALKLRTQWSSATLVKIDTDAWVAFGDLSA
jgi:hypothetical protein